ncbi:hypothetical protein OROMI_009541 [Orobanche minor]
MAEEQASTGNCCIGKAVGGSKGALGLTLDVYYTSDCTVLEFDSSGAAFGGRRVEKNKKEIGSEIRTREENCKDEV